MATPLKVKDAFGNIQELTDAEENYLTYLIGTHLASDSANGIGGITTNSGHTTIGSYTNTFFNEPVGTHPSTSITTGSTTTTLYQNQGTAASETDSDVEIPLMWVDAGGQTGFKQMPAADLNATVDRYLTKLFTNDYPGVFKLGSASPSPDYSTWLTSVFTDTRTDGTSVVYNIYRRDTYSVPTAIPPMFVRDNGGFDGIQAMTVRKIKQSFGQRAKSRIGASKIGTYQLRSSIQGAPTDPGTWISAGAATDTKQTTSQQQFTSVFTAQYQKAYTRAYTRVFSGTYTQTYVKTRNLGYTGAGFAALYSRSFLRQQSESFGRNYTRLYTGNYVRRYTRAYTPNYIKRYTGNYTRTFVGNFNTAYQRSGPAAYDPSYYIANVNDANSNNLINYPTKEIRVETYHMNNTSISNAPQTDIIQEAVVGYGSTAWSILVGSYEGLKNFEARNGPDFIGPWKFLSSGSPVIPSSIQANLDPNTLGLVTGVLYGGSIGNIHPTSTSAATRLHGWALRSTPSEPGMRLAFAPPTSATYQWGVKWRFLASVEWYFETGRAYQGPGQEWFAFRMYITDVPFIPYGNSYARSWPSGGISNNSKAPVYDRSYDGSAQLYIRDMGYLNPANMVTAKPGWYLKDIATNAFRLYLGPAAGDVTIMDPHILDYAMERFFNGREVGIDAAGLMAAGVGYLGGYTALATVNYTTAYDRNYETNFVRLTDVGYTGAVFNAGYDRNFIRNTNLQYLRNYTGIYSSVYTGAYDKLYTPNYIRTYTGNYDTGYASAYTSLFNTSYLTDYIKAYTGNFEGLTIDATDETNETYTLYVRIS